MFNFLAKKAMEHKLKDVPPEQREMLMKLIEKNPDLFKKMGNEIKAKTKEGINEQTASMQVMMKYKNELQKIAKDIQN